MSVKDTKHPQPDHDAHGADHADEGANNRAKMLHEQYQRHVLPYENLIVGAALVNEGIEKWEGIRLRHIKDTVLRIAKIPNATLQTFSKPEMADMIEHVTIDDKLGDWVARDFLKSLLNSKGEQGVLAFVERARKAIDERQDFGRRRIVFSLDQFNDKHMARVIDQPRLGPRRGIEAEAKCCMPGSVARRRAQQGSGFSKLFDVRFRRHRQRITRSCNQAGVYIARDEVRMGIE
jgi:hypothetical protein